MHTPHARLQTMGNCIRGGITDTDNLVEVIRAIIRVRSPRLVATQSSNTFTFCHSSYYNNYALQDNGYVWVTGHGGHYINGLGNNSNINTFTRINLPNVIDIHANHNIALALTSDNEVYIWGTESNSSMGGVSGTTANTNPYDRTRR